MKVKRYKTEPTSLECHWPLHYSKALSKGSCLTYMRLIHATCCFLCSSELLQSRVHVSLFCSSGTQCADFFFVVGGSEGLDAPAYLPYRGNCSSALHHPWAARPHTATSRVQPSSNKEFTVGMISLGTLAAALLWQRTVQFKYPNISVFIITW